MTRTPLDVFRVYEPHELGADGYPEAWHRLPADSPVLDMADLVLPDGIKHVVRAYAGERCLRCLHPYRATSFGANEWATPPRVEMRRAQLDPEVEIVAIALDDDTGHLPPEAIEHRRKRGTEVLYSPCSRDCAHGGPARWREDSLAMWKEVTGDEPIGRLVANGAQVQAEFRILTVHHLNGRKFDCRWWNLAALCQRCHLVIQRKVQMERVYPFEHTPWFRPFAAGWYAQAYLGESLTREQVDGRLDELLALERMA